MSPDQILTAAEGYLELRMPAEAAAELELLDPRDKVRTNVLRMRRDIYEKAKSWPLLEVVTRELVRRNPHDVACWSDWAMATRRAFDISKANDILLEAERLHPEDPLIQYNLACYACQLGDLDGAKTRAKRAFEKKPLLRSTALDDIDLEPLWASLG